MSITTENDIVKGNFASRIAKFSLVEFAGVMRASGWNFSVSIAIQSNAMPASE